MDEDDRFPLEQWFDVSQRISRAQVEDAMEQMSVYAMKDGEPPTGKRWRQAVAQLRAAVRAHNQQFEQGR